MSLQKYASVFKHPGSRTTFRGKSLELFPAAPLFGLIPLAGTVFLWAACSRSVAADCTATITAR